METRLSNLAQRLNINIEYLDATTSTNDIAAQSHYKHGDVVIAEYQSKGRGQRGNSWESTKEQNLTFTMVLATDIHITKQFYISKCTALGIVDTIKHYNGQLNVKIKWPNDIYVDDKKICGILIENDICGCSTSKSMIGIGFNVNQTEFDPALPNPSSLSICCQSSFDRAEVFERLYSSIHKYFDMLAQGLEDQITELYIDSIYRYEQWHKFRDSENGVFEGCIVDIEEDGQIIIKNKNNISYKYYFKDVEYQL